MKDDATLIQDILNTAREIVITVKGVSRPAFVASHDKRGAVVYDLIIIGEASSKLSAAFKNTHSSLPWSKIAGMRNIAVHEYSEVNYDIVWKTARDRIPEIIKYLSALKGKRR